MEFMGGNSGAGMIGSGSSAARWNDCSFEMQGTGTDLLKQVEQLMAITKKEKLSKSKK